MVLVQLKYKDIAVIKEKWYKEQKGICPLFKKKYNLEDFTLDHMHCLKSENPDEISGKGLCRGAIHYQANSIEGKFQRVFKRLGGDKHIDFISFLRNLADYLEFNKINTEEKYIHPTEKPKAQKLKKTSYNKLVKIISGKQKVPEYHNRNGNFTKKLELLFKKYQVEPEFYKG